MELVAHGSSRFCRGLCALQTTPSGLLYDPNMSEAENWSTSRPTNEFRNKHARAQGNNSKTGWGKL